MRQYVMWHWVLSREVIIDYGNVVAWLTTSLVSTVSFVSTVSIFRCESRFFNLNVLDKWPGGGLTGGVLEQATAAVSTLSHSCLSLVKLPAESCNTSSYLDSLGQGFLSKCATQHVERPALIFCRRVEQIQRQTLPILRADTSQWPSL